MKLNSIRIKYTLPALFVIVFSFFSFAQTIKTPGEIKAETLYPVHGKWVASQYEKLEIGIQLPDIINKEVDQYLAGHEPYPAPYEGLNPFNPQDISLVADFFSPDQSQIKITRFGFYFKDYRVIETPFNYDYWEEIATPWHWRIRFTPDNPGNWSVRIRIVLRDSTMQTETYFFECLDSENNGFLRVNSQNNRFLEYENNSKPFFGIGMNVAIPGYTPGCSGSDPAKMDEHRDYIKKLGETQANFTRMVLDPKTFNFEWEELGNYNAPYILQNKTADMIVPVGRLALAWELDKTFETLENNGFNFILCFEIHFPFMYFNPYYPNDHYIWTYNPYRKIQGVDLVEDFLTHPKALEIYQWKLRYLFARYGYSPCFTGFEFLSEMEFFGGSKTETEKIYPYWRDEDFIVKLTNWHNEMAHFLRQELQVKQLISSSYAYKPYKMDRINAIMDFVSMHRYGNIQPINSTHRKKEIDEYLNDWEKPFILGEFGLSDGFSRLLVCMDNSFANDIWASAFMGGFSTGLYWWWERVIEYEYHVLFNHMATYFDSIDFENRQFTRRQGGQSPVKKPKAEYLALTDMKGRAAIGWVHNYSVYWNNLYEQHENCIMENNYQEFFKDSQKPKKVRCGRINLTGLKKNTEFVIKWFNTRSGEWETANRKMKSNGEGKAKIRIPLLGKNPETVQPPTDYAFILETEE